MRDTSKDTQGNGQGGSDYACGQTPAEGEPAEPEEPGIGPAVWPAAARTAAAAEGEPACPAGSPVASPAAAPAGSPAVSPAATPAGSPDASPDTSPDAPGTTPAAASAKPSLVGLIAAASSFVVWGLLPIFWKALDRVDSFEILCHRVVWSFVCLCPLMFMHGRLGALLILLRNPKNLLGLCFTGYILAGNWYLYIWAINHNYALEASLGYYINPLINILFGMIFFREKLTRTVGLAICIAALGVGWQVVRLGHLPFIPLCLALSFGTYALVRKVLVVEAIPGLFMETLFVVPLAAFWLVSQRFDGAGVFFRGDYWTDFLLVATGIITTVPLLCFTYGTQRIRMSTLGLLQYFTPTCVLLLGVFVYGEAFTFDNLITFSCIWIALVLYTRETIRSKRW